MVSRRVAFGATVRLPHAFKYRRLPVHRFLALSGPVRDELVALGVPPERIDLVPDAVDVAAVEQAVAAARADGRAAARRALAGPGDGRRGRHDRRVHPGEGAGHPPRRMRAGPHAAAGPSPRQRTRGGRPCAASPRRGADVGFVAGDDVFTTLAAIDVLVVPSRAEGLGSIVLAAQAAGVPVIAAATGGLPEIVRDGRTGLLVPADDPTALAAALDRVHDDPEATRARARRSPRGGGGVRRGARGRAHRGRLRRGARRRRPGAALTGARTLC